ncbi:unnamed protein product [Dovyalis caffra]|uniref:Cytochrome P450 n=1 Tax=Dovyalis caffra TaxID=77055 RepID=A0AAV1RBH4_9ROSI|nr:unnamed protein product [Dovyalis caffra]
MEAEKFLTVDFIPQLMFGILFASFETMSTTLTLTLKFLSENPQVVEELTAEHEAILRKRKNPNYRLTWEEYRSMTFIRMKFPGYTVPAGWTVILATLAIQLNPRTFRDPLTFNPCR